MGAGRWARLVARDSSTIDGIGSSLLSQILIRRLDPDAIARLRERAHREGRSLEEECRRSLVEASQRGGLLEAVEAWRRVWPAPLDDEPDPFAEVRQRGPGRPVKLG